MPRKPLLLPTLYGWLVLWALAPMLVRPPVARAADAPPPLQSPPPKASAPAVVPPPKDVAELKVIEEKVKQIVSRVLPATVALRIGASQGSGVVVSKDGYVLTAGHVLGKPGQQVSFIFPDGKTLKGTTLGVNQDADAGLAKITDQGDWPFVEMRKAGALQPGMWCLALGHPLGIQEGRPPVVRFGRVLQVRDSFVQSDCTIVAGDSGGPLVDLEGQVIGINSRITAGMTMMNFHVPIDAFHQSWDRLVKSETWHTHVEGKDSAPVKGPFRQVVAEAGRCVVRVQCDGGDAALGTIVGPDGWVLTKASQLKGRIVCRTADGQQREARLVGLHDGFDLAMLKIDASGLPGIAWAGQARFEVGQWVATPGPRDGAPLALGVLSVPPRKIPPQGGVLGITLADPDAPARIGKILPDSAAQKAGLQENDVVTHFNDKPIASRTELIAAIKQFRPGKTVRLTVKRDDKVLQISATLGKLDTPGSKKRNVQNLAGPGVNERHDDFARVLQHDTVLVPTDCGGPLVDLSGQVIGVNIARAGRTETYAVPTDALLPLLYDLISGRLPPPKPEPKPESKPEPKAAPKPESKPEPKPQPKTEPKPEPKAAPKPEPKPEEKPQPPKSPPPAPQSPKTEPKPESKPQPQSKPEAPKAEPLTLPQAKRPDWLARDGIVMAGSWEPLVFRVRRDGKSYAPTPDQLAGYRREHGPEMVARLKALGVNFVMMHCYKGAGVEAERESMADAVRFAKLCHDAGLRVGVYNYSGAFLWELFFKEVPQAKDWVVRDARGNPLTYDGAGYRYYWNRNHPEAEAFYRKLVRFAVEEIRTDLVHFDNYVIGPGHEEVSVARFRRYLGENFAAGQLAAMGLAGVESARPPGPGAPALLGRAWLDFCSRSLAESYYSMGRYARSLRPDVLVECNPNGVGGAIRPPVDHGRMLQGGEAYWVESGRIGYRDGRLVSRIRNYKVGRAMDNLTFDYTLTPLEMAESMAFNLDCLGCLCWFEYGQIVAMPGSSDPMSPALEPYVRFFHRRRDLLRGASVVADAAVLRSFPSQVFGGPEYSRLTSRVEDLLIERRGSFQIIHDHQLDDLGRYRALVLAGCVALGDRQVEAIRRYVAAGGRLCVVGPLATHDQWMMPRPKPALDDLPAASVVRAAETDDLLAAIRKACGGTLSLSISAADRGEAPPGLCAELTQQPSRRLVHLVNYRSDGPIRDLAVAAGLPAGSRAKGVTLASPDRRDDRPLEFQQEAGVVRFTVPEVKIYEIAVVDLADR